MVNESARRRLVRWPWTWAALVALLLASWGEPAAAQSCANLTPGDYSCSINSGGTNRSYLVHVPAGVDPGTPVPLVVDMHGFTSTASAQQGLSGWLEKSDTEGFIATWPQGISNSWNAQGDCCGSSNEDDVQFIRDLVAEIRLAAHIDPDRIYATGLSNGGSMTHTLACEAADLFAGAAAVSFGLSGGNDDFNQTVANCNPTQGVPVMHFHGTSDGLVNYNNGVLDSLGAPDTLAAWSLIQSCDPISTTEQISANTSCESHADCIDGAEVVLCTVSGGTHVLYPDVEGTTIADEAWAFFEVHAMPEPGSALMLCIGAGALAALAKVRRGRAL